MNHFLLDIHFTFRLFKRSPAFFATLLTILIAGIGATTAMFSIVESLLLKPLPYPNSEQLTAVWATQPKVNPSPASLADFLDWKAQGTTFERMAAIDYDAFSLSSEGSAPEYLPGVSVTGDFFPLLGIQPLIGRFLGTEDDRVGAPRVAVLSAAVWHRRFGSDPNIVGRAIRLSSEAYTVIGIAPEGFRFGGPQTDRAEVWTPLAVSMPNYAKASTSLRGNHFLHVIGRLKTDVTLEQAQAQMTGVAKTIESTHPDSNTKVGVRLVNLQEALVGSLRESVLILFAAIAIVFLIVCANVANLLLTRAQSRRSEMAARLALGATASRLVVQLLNETVVIFLIGALGGAALSGVLVKWFASGIINGGGVATIDLHVDWVVLTVCVLSSITCGIVFGLIPAFAVARTQPQAVLQESAARSGTSRSQKWIRSALVIAQVACAFALLYGAASTFKVFTKVASTPPGFDPNDLAIARAVLPETKYENDDKAIAFYRDAIARIASHPLVESIAANSTLPMAGSNSNGSFQIEGKPEWSKGDEPLLERNIVTPGYFRTMKIPLLQGRDFSDADVRDGRLVMIISQTTAERFFPGENPIGHRIDWGDARDGEEHSWREIIGVVGDVRRRGLAEPIAAESYVPLAQYPNRWMVLVARSQHAPELLQALPGLIQSVDPEQALAGRNLMVDRVAQSIQSQRYVAILLGGFAIVALLLATLGIYGLVSYSTQQRTREFGIRMALGASPLGVVSLVLGSVFRFLWIGLGLGFLGALMVGQILATRISGLSLLDGWILSSIAILLSVTGLIACLIPVWRAVRIPPAIALRYE